MPAQSSLFRKTIAVAGFLLLSLLVFSSCHRVKNKGEALKAKAEEKTKDLADKVVPHFDAYRPDTKYNKERFREFFGIELTPDIRELYCFGDAIGIDADYQFSFSCDSSTAKRIIQKLQLARDTATTDFAFGLQSDFSWWDKKKIEKLPLYSWKGEHEFYKYFWYDPKGKKAWYFEFDM